jgi:hypothetical protein
LTGLEVTLGRWPSHLRSAPEYVRSDNAEHAGAHFVFLL